METTLLTSPDQLDETTVEKVYSGRNGRCCCGCSGKYSYPATEAKSFRIMLKKIKGILVTKDCDEIETNVKYSPYVSIVIGNRLLIAYLKQGYEFDSRYEKSL